MGGGGGWQSQSAKIALNLWKKNSNFGWFARWVGDLLSKSSVSIFIFDAPPPFRCTAYDGGKNNKQKIMGKIGNLGVSLSFFCYHFLSGLQIFHSLIDNSLMLIN